MTGYRPALAACNALAMAVLATGCAAPLPDRLAAPSKAAPLRLAQIGYGQEARFEPCRMDACPQRTPKTLPSSPPDPIASAPAVSSVRLDAAAGNAEAGQSPLQAGPSEQRLDIEFPITSALLDAQAHKALRALAPRLAHARQIHVIARTGVPANERLAKARANEVLHALLALAPGIAPITTVDLQDTCCEAAPNGRPAGRAGYRRVEIRYLLESDATP